MTTSINVDKQSISTFLYKGSEKNAEIPFIIPEYQRPYAWNIDQIQVLFDDIWDFALNYGGTERPDGTYFLGSIVSYENDNHEMEIIDGQQRITSLFLLLRAIYTHLKNAPSSPEGENFIKQTGVLIWKANKLTGAIDYSKTLIESRVINNLGNEILKQILRTGIANENTSDNYSKNYIILQNLFTDHCAHYPLQIYNFIYALLHQVIVLPITADSQETALTIFSTLNDRGLPLSDADIFKAKIYNHLSDDKKSSFIRQWQDLSLEAERADESIQSLFYYYMFYIRACKKDNKTTTPGLRKYYLNEENNILYSEDLMDNLKTIVNLLKVMNKRIESENTEEWVKDTKVRQLLDILSSYPNDFGKYPIIIYYLKYHNENGFTDAFRLFLRKFAKEIIIKFILAPYVNAIKGDILNLNVEIIKSIHPKFNIKIKDETMLKEALKSPHNKTIRMLLSILAYEKQEQLLPNNPKWEIEHIFPQSWQPAYFPKENEDTIRTSIEFIGNKIPFEKKLNIIAGNGYFDKKKIEYSRSNIHIAKEMANFTSHEWNLDDITERNIRVIDELLKIFEKWSSDYDNESNATQIEPTLEEQKLIEKFKERGWVN